MNFIFCKLEKPQKTWISFFASLKNLKKHEFHFFLQGWKTSLWQKKSTGSATLKKFSLFAFGFSLFAFETGCLFFAFRFWISAFRFSISDYVTVVFFSILVFDFRLFNFKKNSELSSQFLISIIQFVTFYKYLFTWVYSVSFAKITHPVD